MKDLIEKFKDYYKKAKYEHENSFDYVLEEQDEKENLEWEDSQILNERNTMVKTASEESLENLIQNTIENTISSLREENDKLKRNKQEIENKLEELLQREQKLEIEVQEEIDEKDNIINNLEKKEKKLQEEIKK